MEECADVLLKYYVLPICLSFYVPQACHIGALVS